MKNTFLFIKEMWRDFHHTGAIAPSSPSLARAITRSLSKKKSPTTVLEVGAGTGVFTREIINLLTAGDTLDVYEINPTFIPALEKILDPKPGNGHPGIRTNLHATDILKLDKIGCYDFIVSGLPLNNFDADTVHAILDVLMQSLKPGGTLCYFEYMFLRRIKCVAAGPAERTRLKSVTSVLERFLEKHQTERIGVWLNLPPAYVRVIRK
jgi:phosphatidylethanolamine/phosphatidyl-N-methylethanolamine N-methyltransferase